MADKEIEVVEHLHPHNLIEQSQGIERPHVEAVHDLRRIFRRTVEEVDHTFPRLRIVLPVQPFAPIATGIKLRKVILDSQFLSCHAIDRFQFLSTEIAHLEEGDHLLLGIAESSQQDRTAGAVAQFHRRRPAGALFLLRAMVTQDIRLLGARPLFLHPRRLVVEAMALHGHKQGEERIDQRTLSRSIRTGEQGIVALRTDTVDHLVESSPVEDLHILQTIARFLGCRTK